MAGMLNIFVPQPIVDENNNIQSGAKVYFYDAGTTTDAAVYQDKALTTQHPQPVVADAGGRIANVYAPSGKDYKIVITTSSDVDLPGGADNIPPYIASGASVLPIPSGGTNANSAAGARTNLSVPELSDFNALNSTVSTISTAQSTATWEAGTGTSETVVSPAKVKAAIAAVAKSGEPGAILYDTKASGTGGGTFTQGAWQKRTLNTETDPDSLATLSNDEFSFTKAGYVEWSAPGGTCGQHQTRLYNVTDSVAVAPSGESAYSNTATLSQTHSRGRARVEASKTYRLEHRCAATRATDGFGFASNFGDPEKYAEVKYYPDL